MADTSERIVILSALLLVIIIVISQEMNLSDKFSPSEKTAIQISRDFLDGVGRKTGKVLFIQHEEKEPNFYWDIALKSDVEWDRLDIWDRMLKWDRPEIRETRLCWVIRFEQAKRPGHFYEVWLDASEYIVVGGTSCR
jgi:hypothetical protein